MSWWPDNPTLNRILDHEGFPGRWEILETADETGGSGSRLAWSWTNKGSYRRTFTRTPRRATRLSLGTGGARRWGLVDSHRWRKTRHPSRHGARVPKPGFRRGDQHPPPGDAVRGIFRRFHTLKTERGVPIPPDGLKAMILLAMLLVEYEDEQVAVSPPHWAFKILARVGRVLGYRLPERRAARYSGETPC